MELSRNYSSGSSTTKAVTMDILSTPMLIAGLVALSAEVRRWVVLMDKRSERKADRRYERELAGREHLRLEEGPLGSAAA